MGQYDYIIYKMISHDYIDWKFDTEAFPISYFLNYGGWGSRTFPFDPLTLKTHSKIIIVNITVKAKGHSQGQRTKLCKVWLVVPYFKYKVAMASQ